MNYIKTVLKMQLFLLLISVGLLTGNSEASTFNLGEININVPKRIGGFISNIPGVSSIFKPNNRELTESSLHKSLGPLSVNVNIQRPQQYGGGNHQYISSPAADTQPNFYGYNYSPSPQSPYYYGLGPSTYPQQFSQAHQPYWPPEYTALQSPHLFPQSPQPYSGLIDQNPSRPIFETITMPPLAPITNNPAYQPAQPQSYINENPSGPMFENLKMPTLTPIENTNITSSSRNIKRIITPDSPLYVKIKEEPTIYGIEPRR